MKQISFPAMDIPAEAKLKRMLENISEYMNFPIEIKTMTVMVIVFPSDRQDAEIILNSVKKCMDEKYG